jgi:imidazolonepropionase-like amidohydrolase
MARYGTTTAEAKSGYGLDLANELKQLRAIRAANATSPVRLVPTCARRARVPAGASRDVCRAHGSSTRSEILPAVAAEKLAVFCDAFVERGVFTREQGEVVLRAGQRSAMIPRLHADELSDTDGASLAAEARRRVRRSPHADLRRRHRRARGVRHRREPAARHELFPDVRRYAPARALIDAARSSRSPRTATPARR